MPWPVTINGHNYQEVDFGPYSYVVNFPAIVQDVSDIATATANKAAVVDTKHSEVVADAATVATSKDTAVAAAAVAAPALGLIADSTTSLAIATGDKTFTVPTGKGFVAGMPVRASSKANPDTQAMIGVVKSYSSTTLVINVTSVVGSATRADWTIAVTGGALAPVGAGQDAQAIARYAEIMDGLRGAAVPDRPNILLDWLSSTFFVRNAYAGASLAALIAVLPGSTFVRSSTATYFDAVGVMRAAATHEPRFDYEPATKLPLGLLLEPSATNLFINSEVFGNGGRVTVTANTTTAPDGATTADRIVEDSSTGEHYANDRTIALTAGQTYCFSAFVKASSARNVALRVAGSGTAGNAVFNQATGAYVGGYNGPGPSITGTGSRAIGNGWYRIWIIVASQATESVVFRVQLADGINFPYTGDGVSSVDVWGAQVEVGREPSSYIATGASAVTRASDALTLILPSLLTLTAGTLVTEFAGIQPLGSNNVPLHITDDASQNTLYVGRNANGSGTIVLTAGGTNLVATTGGMAWPGDGIVRAAVRYAAGDVAWAWNSAIVGTNNVFTAFTALTRLSSALNAPCYLRRAVFVPAGLTNAKLQALTNAATWS